VQNRTLENLEPAIPGTYLRIVIEKQKSVKRKKYLSGEVKSITDNSNPRKHRVSKYKAKAGNTEKGLVLFLL
jgi:hypothetical protein